MTSFLYQMRNVIFYIVKFYFLIKNIKIYNYNLFFYNNKKQLPL